MWCRASSMPKPSRSNLTSPMVAQSSLSHCRTVRPGIRAGSTGQTSTIGRSQMTMPPEWMPRWRGEPSSWPARLADDGRDVVAVADGLVPIGRLGPPVELVGRVTEGLADVADSRAVAVRDDVGDLGGVPAVVLLVDVLDHLLAPAGLDVEVDVRRALAGRAQEPGEEQLPGHGVDDGDAEDVADGGGGGRATALAVDVRALGRTRRCRRRSGSTRRSRACRWSRARRRAGPRRRPPSRRPRGP